MDFLFLMLDGKSVESWTKEQQRSATARMRVFQESLIASGRYNGGGAVGQGVDASRISVSNNALIAESGTLVDAERVAGGFMIIECASLVDAIKLGKSCPAVEWASIEVRQLFSE